jgi:hypothetical protein
MPQWIKLKQSVTLNVKVKIASTAAQNLLILGPSMDIRNWLMECPVFKIACLKVN